MNKTVTILKANNYETTYGGEIYLSDFNTNYPTNKFIADRIISDWRFDAQCKRKKNSEN